MHLRRGAEPLLHQLLDSAKVVIVEGGRGVGKTTLVRRVAAARDFQAYFDLSDPADRSLLEQDPHRVLAASATPILIDEAQLAPELTVAVKRLVDDGDNVGQVLLTGSARIGRGALGGGDPLAGRAVRLRLNPFTQGELAGEPTNHVERWWQRDFESSVYPELGLRALFSRLTIGGIPAMAISAGDSAPDGEDHRRRLFDTYVEGVLTMNVAGTRTDHAKLLQTFRYLAANPAQILNVSRAASELSMRVETVQGHIDVCEASFLLDVAPAHRPAQHKTVTAHPRLFASDVGLAAWAAETSVDRLIKDAKLSGALLENLVAVELGSQANWMSSAPTRLHWRDTRAAKEVDLVLRKPNGELMGVEVKSSSAVTMADAKGLQVFAERAGDRLVCNVIVYTGRAVQQLDERTWAVPVASLFGASPSVG